MAVLNLFQTPDLGLDPTNHYLFTGSFSLPHVLFHFILHEPSNILIPKPQAPETVLGQHHGNSHSKINSGFGSRICGDAAGEHGGGKHPKGPDVSKPRCQ